MWMLVPNPLSQPVTGRFYSRAMSSTEEELIQQGQLEPWHIEDDGSDDHDREEDELDREQFKARKRKRKHVAVGSEVRPCFIRVMKSNLICAGCL